MGRRHWKQKFDPAAKFIFLRRLKLGLDPKKPWVTIGDPVPTGDARLGKGRLKKWWEAEVIGLADWVDPDVKKREHRAKMAELEDETALAIASSREDALEALQALDAGAEAALLGYHEGVLYGALRGPNGLTLYAAPTAMPIPEGSVATWTDVPVEMVPKEVIDGFDAEVEAALAEGGEEPVEPEAEEPSITTDPLPGPHVEATPDGFDVSMPTGELAAVGTIEEAIAFVQTGEVPEPEPGVMVAETGGGWYSVTVPGEPEPRKVQGKEALDALLAELGVTIEE